MCKPLKADELWKCKVFRWHITCRTLRTAVWTSKIKNKKGGHHPFKWRYDVICNDIFFYKMLDNLMVARCNWLFWFFCCCKTEFCHVMRRNIFQDFTPCNFIYRDIFLKWSVTPYFFIFSINLSFAINLPKISKINRWKIFDKITEHLHSIETHVKKGCSTEGLLLREILLPFLCNFLIAEWPWMRKS